MSKLNNGENLKELEALDFKHQEEMAGFVEVSIEEKNIKLEDVNALMETIEMHEGDSISVEEVRELFPSMVQDTKSMSPEEYQLFKDQNQTKDDILNENNPQEIEDQSVEDMMSM